MEQTMAEENVKNTNDYEIEDNEPTKRNTKA